ncbi:hypothetical protein [Nitrosomonas mobilis]|nr:hypothetical protein [Nitrosomonas mobilis]
MNKEIYRLVYLSKNETEGGQARLNAEINYYIFQVISNKYLWL